MKIFQYLKNTISVAPSILAADFANLEEECKLVEEAGADLLHIDVMDGHFVPNISLGPPIIQSLRSKTDMFLDVHLMISNPQDYIESFVKSGADHITFHVESNSDIDKTIQLIHSFNISAGLTLKPSTNFTAVEPFLDKIEMLLIMTVEPGFGGQSFMVDMMPKIQKSQDIIKRKNLNLLIEVDGGINNKTAIIAKNAGADILVAGTYLFKHPKGIRAAIDSLN